MTDRTAQTDREVLRRLPIVLIALVAAIGAFFLRDYFSFETLRENREMLIALRDRNYPLAVACFVTVYILIVAFSLPGATIASLTGGFLFAVFPGALFNICAAAAGATLIFLAAKTGLGDRLADRMEHSQGAVKRIKDGIDENQWSFLFLIRLVPVVPFFVANLVPAMLGVPLWRFVVTTAIGIVPGAVVYTAVGAGLGDAFARDEAPDLGIIFEPQILLPMLGLAALAAMPPAYRALRARGR